MGFEVNGNSGQKPVNWADYQGYCWGMNNMLPFLGDIFMQCPPPWIQGYFQQQWFGNPNYGQIGDLYQFQCNYAPTDTVGGGGGGGRVERSDDSNLTPEEKLAQREEQSQQNYEINKLVENYNKMYQALEVFAKTLDDNSDPKKSVFNDILGKYKDKAKSSMKKEDIEREIKNLKAVYNKHAEKVKDANLEEAKKNVTSTTNNNYNKYVTSLKTANDNDTTFGGILKGNNGPLSWNDEVDILELLSTWNSTSGDTESSHVMKTILTKYNSVTGNAISNYQALKREFENKLLSVADKITVSEREKLTGDTKTALETAINDLKDFGDISVAAANPELYSRTFDNLYRAIRLAKAEIADKDLKEKFDILGEENPYKDGQFLAEAKEDLKNEKCENAYKVTGLTLEELKNLEGALSAASANNIGAYSHQRDGNNQVDNSNGEFWYYYDTTSNKFRYAGGHLTPNGKCYDKKGGTLMGTFSNGTFTPVGGSSSDAGSDGKQVKINGYIYKVTGSGNDTRYVRTTDNVSLSASDLGISNVNINSDGSYNYTLNGVTYYVSNTHTVTNVSS